MNQFQFVYPGGGCVLILVHSISEIRVAATPVRRHKERLQPSCSFFFMSKAITPTFISK